MTADAFVRELKNVAPSIQQLQHAGLSAREAEEFRRSYICVARGAITGEPISDPLLDLIARYELGVIEIGIVTFAGDFNADRELWQVGKVQVDPLVKDKGTGEIQVRDRGSRERLLWRCARDGGRFLDALLPAAAFLGRCAYDPTAADDDARRAVQAEACAAAAGGGDYLNFYRMLLACE